MSESKGLKRKRGDDQRGEEQLTPIEKAIRESRVKLRRLSKPDEHVILLFSESMMKPEKADYDKLRKVLCEKTLEDSSLGRLTSVNDYDARGLKVTCSTKEIATRVLELMAPTENWKGVLLAPEDPKNYFQLNIAPECPAEYLIDR